MAVSMQKAMNYPTKLENYPTKRRIERHVVGTVVGHMELKRKES
jgi:hypothetical protein